MKVTDLDVWKAAMELATRVYALTDNFPDSQQFGLSFHLRSSVTHLPAQISAAASRKYGTESLKYLFKAKTLVYEIESMLYLAQRLNFISDTELEEHIEILDSSRRLLFGFIKYYKKTAN